MIYLDYSANTPVDPLVLERFCQTERFFIGNANSLHSAGVAARAEMARVTESIASMLHVHPSELIYTSGASEANNLALKGIAQISRHLGTHIISTALEHSSVSGCLTALQEQGYTIDLVDIKKDGTLDLDHLQQLLRQDTVLVAISAVDSELGVVQPVAKIAQILREYPNCRLHVDATQAMGKIDVSFSGVDTMSFTAHKFYGLNGCGILFKRKGLAIEPLIHGGASTTVYRSGTPTVALSASIELALRIALSEQNTRKQVVAEHNAILRAALSAYERVRINSPQSAIPHILNLSVLGIKATTFQKALDGQGVCVSVKSACSSDALPSRAVFAVSRDRKHALSSWRISLSHLTTTQEIRAFLTAFDRCYTALVNPT